MVLTGYVGERMHQHRTQRVSEAVREELAEIISFELSDPRLGAIEVTEVQVAPDLRHAHVRISLPGHEGEQQRAMAALDHARHYLRRELARRLNLRRAPELHFQLDPWANTDAQVDRLLKRAKKNRGALEN